MDSKESKLACDEHIDIAIDDYINEKESFPNMITHENGKCSYCDKNSKYMIE